MCSHHSSITVLLERTLQLINRDVAAAVLVKKLQEQGQAAGHHKPTGLTGNPGMSLLEA